jgi:hypothetical protein
MIDELIKSIWLLKKHQFDCFLIEYNCLQHKLENAAKQVLADFFMHCVYFFRIVDERDSSGGCIEGALWSVFHVLSA